MRHIGGAFNIHLGAHPHPSRQRKPERHTQLSAHSNFPLSGAIPTTRPRLFTPPTIYGPLYLSFLPPRDFGDESFCSPCTFLTHTWAARLNQTTLGRARLPHKRAPLSKRFHKRKREHFYPSFSNNLHQSLNSSTRGTTLSRTRGIPCVPAEPVSDNSAVLNAAPL